MCVLCGPVEVLCGSIKESVFFFFFLFIYFYLGDLVPFNTHLLMSSTKTNMTFVSAVGKSQNDNNNYKMARTVTVCWAFAGSWALC